MKKMWRKLEYEKETKNKVRLDERRIYCPTYFYKIMHSQVRQFPKFFISKLRDTIHPHYDYFGC